MKVMADLDLLFAEELCPADDVLGRRWLVDKVDVPFIADESVPTAADVTREVLSGSANAISIKVRSAGSDATSPSAACGERNRPRTRPCPVLARIEFGRYPSPNARLMTV